MTTTLPATVIASRGFTTTGLAHVGEFLPSGYTSGTIRCHGRTITVVQAEDGWDVTAQDDGVARAMHHVLTVDDALIVTARYTIA